MKAMVVDDQMHVYKAIQMQVNWETWDITEVLYAPNGAEALKIMAVERPELVFTDMQMPFMDGPEFLRELREQGYDCEIIAISGYSDFPYMRSVIEASGVEYLLKPLDRTELNNAVRKAAEHIWKKAESRKSQEDIQQDHIDQSCRRIAAWLSGVENFNDEIQEHLRFLGIEEGNYRFSMLLMRGADKVISDLYDGSAAEFRRELLRIAKDLFVKSTKWYLLPVNRYLYILLLQTPIPDAREYEDRMNWMVRVVHNLTNTDFIYAYSERIAAVQQMPSLIEGLKGKLQTRCFCCTKFGVQPMESKSDIRPAGDYENRIGSLSHVIRTAVREKDLETIGNIISDFCSRIRHRGWYSFYELQIYTAEINLLLRKLLMESRELGSFLSRQISPWIYDLDVWESEVQEALLEIASCHFDNAVSVTVVYSYIQENFREELSIPMLSERFNQSPQYLSKLYKNKYNETIGQTIKRVRMEKAQDYLRHSTLPIREIAELVGIEDNNYFGKVFRKYCGVSPQQYRRAAGMPDESEDAE